jgi:hypothetical protein
MDPDGLDMARVSYRYDAGVMSMTRGPWGWEDRSIPDTSEAPGFLDAIER